jgi:DNA-directed RNA polymerase specialized sigma24 family protein
MARQPSEPEVDQLVAAYRAGATVYQLADQFGSHRITVGKHLRARGIDTRPAALTPDDLQRAIQLYRSGWSLAKIAKTFEVAAETIRTQLIQAGVEMRKPWERG